MVKVGVTLGARVVTCFYQCSSRVSQQSSSTKKDKDAMEDKKRNPILKYIGKPKISSQSSEYRDLLGCCTHQPPCCLEEICSRLRAQGCQVAFGTRGTPVHPVAGISRQPPSALLQPLVGNPLSQPSVLPDGFEGSGKGAELSSPPQIYLTYPILQAYRLLAVS